MSGGLGQGTEQGVSSPGPEDLVRAGQGNPGPAEKGPRERANAHWQQGSQVDSTHGTCLQRRKHDWI